jgi:threonine synthase
MQYVSTRGEAPSLGFRDALLAGLARDGGLYLPVEWPQFSADDIRRLRGLRYDELAVRLLEPYLGGEIAHEDFVRIVREAYATFRHPAVCPIVQTGEGEFVL